jgi:hypothetical protein
MFSCSLCREQCEEYVFVQSHCTECEQIRRIISLYNKKSVLDTLRTVYLRDEKPIQNRTNKIVKEKELESLVETEPRKSGRNKVNKMVTQEAPN